MGCSITWIDVVRYAIFVMVRFSVAICTDLGAHFRAMTNNYILLPVDHPIVRQFLTSGTGTSSAVRGRVTTRARRAKGLPTIQGQNVVAGTTPIKRRRRARRRTVAANQQNLT